MEHDIDDAFDDAINGDGIREIIDADILATVVAEATGLERYIDMYLHNLASKLMDNMLSASMPITNKE